MNRHNDFPGRSTDAQEACSLQSSVASAAPYYQHTTIRSTKGKTYIITSKAVWKNSADYLKIAPLLFTAAAFMEQYKLIKLTLKSFLNLLKYSIDTMPDAMATYLFVHMHYHGLDPNFLVGVEKNPGPCPECGLGHKGKKQLHTKLCSKNIWTCPVCRDEFQKNFYFTTHKSECKPDLPEIKEKPIQGEPTTTETTTTTTTIPSGKQKLEEGPNKDKKLVADQLAVEASQDAGIRDGDRDLAKAKEEEKPPAPTKCHPNYNSSRQDGFFTKVCDYPLEKAKRLQRDTKWADLKSQALKTKDDFVEYIVRDLLILGKVISSTTIATVELLEDTAYITAEHLTTLIQTPKVGEVELLYVEESETFLSDSSPSQFNQYASEEIIDNQELLLSDNADSQFSDFTNNEVIYQPLENLGPYDFESPILRITAEDQYLKSYLTDIESHKQPKSRNARLFKRVTKPKLQAALDDFINKLKIIRIDSLCLGGRKKTKFSEGFFTLIQDFVDIKDWYGAYSTDESIVHAELALSWVADPDVPTATHTGHFNRSDEPIVEEQLTKATYVIRMVAFSDSEEHENYELFCERPRVADLQHLGLPGCMDQRTTDEGLDRFKEIEISFSACTNTVSWRCNKTNSPEDRAARARTAFNTMPNTTFMSERLRENKLVMEDTWEFITMHLNNSPWGELQVTNPVK